MEENIFLGNAKAEVLGLKKALNVQRIELYEFWEYSQSSNASKTRASFWHCTECDGNRLWLCLCKVVYRGRGHYLMSLYETFSGAIFCHSSMGIRITLIFSLWEKINIIGCIYLMKHLSFLIINEPILSQCYVIHLLWSRNGWQRDYVLER